MQDPSCKQQTKQKYKPGHQQTGLPPHSALPIRGKTSKQTNSAQISPYPKLTQTTAPTVEGQTKRNLEFNHEAWEKETSSTVSFFLKNEKAEKYYTNEGTN